MCPPSECPKREMRSSSNAWRSASRSSTAPAKLSCDWSRLGQAAAPGVVVDQPVILGEGVERTHVLVTELGPAEHDEGWSGAHDLDVDIDVACMRDVNGALQGLPPSIW